MAFIIQGSSIDGRVWLEGLSCWTNSVGFAARFRSLVQADLIARAMRLENEGRNLDDFIGRIEVVEKTDDYLNAEMNKVLAEEASWEE